MRALKEVRAAVVLFVWLYRYRNMYDELSRGLGSTTDAPSLTLSSPHACGSSPLLFENSVVDCSLQLFYNSTCSSYDDSEALEDVGQNSDSEDMSSLILYESCHFNEGEHNFSPERSNALRCSPTAESYNSDFSSTSCMNSDSESVILDYHFTSNHPPSKRKCVELCPPGRKGKSHEKSR